MEIRKIFRILLSAPLLLGCSKPMEEANLKEGDTLPAFSIVMNDGTPVTNASLQVGVSLVAFFHTLCPDCQRELPQLQRIHEDCPDLKMVLVSRNEGEKSILTYWKDNGLTLPFSAQEDDRVFRLFASHTIPRTYIVRDDVIMKAYDDNPVASYEEMEAVIHQLQE